MLSIVVFLPVAVAVVLLAVPRVTDAVVRWAWIATSAAELALVAVLWLGYRGPGYEYEVERRWIPSVSSGYHLGVDGLSLPLVAVTAVIFLACAVHAFGRTDRVRSFATLFLFLETVCLGVFVSLDLVLFFVFFDLSIVGMYFVIACWGHRNAARAALQFFLYTFLGSLALLLGFIGLYLAAEPHTFDMVALAGHPTGSALVLLAVVVGLAVKTPTVPFHTWLPPAHTEAPAEGSAILAGVLLKLGTYGFVRIAMPMLPAAWRDWAGAVVVVGVVSVLYGALVALAQRDFKRMVAYTSVNHMGYVILAVGAAGLSSTSDEQAQGLAVTGAVTQMVSHGLVTGALFLLAGVLYERGGTYDLDAYGGIAAGAPRFAGLTAVAAFASLGLPGFSGFVAEFQILTGSLPGAPVPTALAFLGILVTAALFLRAYQRLFLGTPKTAVGDLTVTETLSIAPLMVLAVVIGLFPRFLLDLVEPAARVLGTLVGR
ncbi:complex I subunit 4 family protein [Actinophytocola oryzae]|uniref:NADH dehydrogenase subunit M n=1 Tax=Actinophytocola oryzae TaxID=502181 RepID=A0A4R7W3S1_9PSEU|nr:NADH-quinone oxidoreductase subunit M [Actinophytocola oryzae]TDV57313.1 NADH dehydrogenase subunit M [Actinophytocola oryzae]